MGLEWLVGWVGERASVRASQVWSSEVWGVSSRDFVLHSSYFLTSFPLRFLCVIYQFHISWVAESVANLLSPFPFPVLVCFQLLFLFLFIQFQCPLLVSFSSSFLSLILFTQFGSVRLIYLFTFSHFIFLLPFLFRPSRSLDISFLAFLSGTRMDRCNFLSNYSFDFISYYIFKFVKNAIGFPFFFTKSYKHSIFK